MKKTRNLKSITEQCADLISSIPEILSEVANDFKLLASKNKKLAFLFPFLTLLWILSFFAGFLNYSRAWVVGTELGILFEEYFLFKSVIPFFILSFILLSATGQPALYPCLAGFIFERSFEREMKTDSLCLQSLRRSDFQPLKPLFPFHRGALTGKP